MTLPDRYTPAAMLLHWVIAALIMANIALIYTTNLLAPEAARGGLIDIHMSVGLTVLGLALLRILWRLSHRPPALPAAYAPWERRAAHAAHAAFYGVMLVLPLSGWLHDSAWKEAPANPYYWFGLFEVKRLPGIRDLAPPVKEIWHARFLVVHTWTAYVLYALLTAHVLGVLKHQFLDRHPELQRMIPWPGRASGAVGGQ
jgi:cytochrome b561